jgi:hypothetical protein
MHRVSDLPEKNAATYRPAAKALATGSVHLPRIKATVATLQN